MKQELHTYKASLFKALGHPLRLAILDVLRGGEQTVTQLQDRTGAEQASVSQHLGVLRAHHFVSVRRDGTLAYYRASDPEIYAFLDLGRQVYERQLQRQREQLTLQAGPA
ncbi:transcriptional regulator [Deinococcus indicus]|uniref:Transcriptional regulator n=1 Tax=Deinococcus indicus TaxID=223556 RepID=A0A246BL68_9DEIO|nr:metalloregulator ArsR/SmtB family transcription factor [Deinococcus indicus]OWL96077.1 transcriptional regulator [Deinococcus indicus]